jgi:arylformamidase
VARRLWDISQRLRPELPVWPGDTAFDSRRTWMLGDESPVNVAAVTFSTHSGAHADAPLHYDPAGAAIDAVELSPYLGPCQLIDARGCGALISLEFVRQRVEPPVERVLFRTYAHFPHAAWDSGFTAVDPAAIDWLAAQGARRDRPLRALAVSAGLPDNGRPPRDPPRRHAGAGGAGAR